MIQEYVDITGKVYHHIYLVQIATEDIDEIGWYFSDEAEEMHGPFDTLQEVEEILRHYYKYILED